MDFQGKFLFGVSVGTIVWATSILIMMVFDQFGFPALSIHHLGAQMVYFMLTGWGMVAFVNHHQKTLSKEVENAKWSASFWEKETQRQKDYKDFYKKLAKQYREHLQQIKATSGEKQ